ncbi:MAG: hypothetical protein JSW37_10450, partial [Anaerolineales bacterium]
METSETRMTLDLLDRDLFSAFRFNRRTAILLVLVVALIFTRLWDLGNRAYSHDESTHAWESWKLVTGQRYVHDPVYHGPFLYHLTAL